MHHLPGLDCVPPSTFHDTISIVVPFLVRVLGVFGSMPRRGLGNRLASTRATVCNVLHEHDPAYGLDMEILCHAGGGGDDDGRDDDHLDHTLHGRGLMRAGCAILQTL